MQAYQPLRDDYFYTLMTDQETVVSQEKFDEMVKELENLKTVRRTEIAKNLEYARSLGDLSENAEYQEARELQAATEERIRKLEELVKHARIQTDNRKKDVVGFGSKVSIMKDGSKDLHEYTIVGSEEADMREHKLSHVSPLGAALMGKKKGETFTFETPNGKQTYTIEKVA
jgi:transcription elongation factor GreA